MSPPLQSIFTSLYNGDISASSINPNLIDLVLEAGVMDETRSEQWLWVYETFYVTKMKALVNETEDDPLASLGFPALIRVLTATRSAAALQWILNGLFDPDFTYPAHIGQFLQQVAYNSRGLELVNAWIQQDGVFTQLQSSLPIRGQGTSVLQTVLSYNSQPQAIAQLTTFFQRQSMAENVRAAVNNGLAAAKVRQDWLSVNYQPISDYLSSEVWRNTSSDIPSPPSPPSPASSTPWLTRRLPDTAQPSSYRVETMIDLDSSPPAFWGTVNITLRVTRPTDFLVLHAHPSLTVADVSMKGEDGLPIEIQGMWNYSVNQFLVLNFTRTVQPQYIATLSMTYYANLTSTPMSGLFLTAYTNSTGQRVNMAATQFEAVGARRAFPCFDEPAFKAEFVLAIHASSRYPTVLSNMPSANSTASPVRSGWVVTRFQPTVVMSTYLVAIVVCDFVYTERQSQCGGSRMIPSRVYAPAHRLNATVIPARIAADIISHYCTYFDIEYPLPKEDHIYIPQFSGAHTTHTHNTAHTAHTRRDSAATVPTCGIAPTAPQNHTTSPHTTALTLHWHHHCALLYAHLSSLCVSLSLSRPRGGAVLLMAYCVV